MSGNGTQYISLKNKKGRFNEKRRFKYNKRVNNDVQNQAQKYAALY